MPVHRELERRFHDYLDIALGKQSVKDVPKAEKARIAKHGWDSVKDSGEKFNRKMNSPVMRQFRSEEIRAIAEEARFLPDDKVLSLGSGTALLEGFIARELVPTGKVIGIDTSDEMTKAAKSLRQKLVGSGSKNLFLVRGNFEKLPFKRHTMDKVLILQFAVNGFARLSPMLNQAREAIKNAPSARLILSAIFTEKQLKRREEFFVQLINHGFIPEKQITLGRFDNNEFGVVITASPATILDMPR
ncbi:MAG: methyltransferase domain-containing protein [archaeon]|nr:methyltransferase domain-containing protein [archaeon]